MTENKTANRTKRSTLVIILFCFIFTLSFGLMGQADAYAYSYITGNIYGPYEPHETCELIGSEVPVKAKYQAMINYNIMTGGDVWRGGGQCWGYAEKVRKLFGGGGRTVQVKKKSTKNNIYNTLHKLKPGTHVRFGNSKTGAGIHSIAVYKVTGSKIYYSEANWDHANGIEHHVMDLADFAKYRAYTYIMWYIQPTGSVSVRTPVITGDSYDLVNKVELAWQPVSGAKKYTVYRSYSKNGKYTPLKTVTKPMYVDKTAKKGAVWYKVRSSNGRYSSPKVIYNRIKSPVVKVGYNKKGYIDLSWEKVKGAVKYAVYEPAYDSNGGYKLKRLVTTKATSYTLIKNTDEAVEFVVKAIPKNTKATSGGTYGYAYRAAPRPKITEAKYNKVYSSADLLFRPLYSCKKYGCLGYNVYRSTTKNGNYECVGGGYIYGFTFAEMNITTYEDYDYEKDLIPFYDDYLDPGTYYYKVALVGGSTMWRMSEGMWSAAVKVEIPDQTTPDPGDGGQDEPIVPEPDYDEEVIQYGDAGSFHLVDDGSFYFITSDGTKKYPSSYNPSTGVLDFVDENGNWFYIYPDGTIVYDTDED